MLTALLQYIIQYFLEHGTILIADQNRLKFHSMKALFCPIVYEHMP